MPVFEVDGTSKKTGKTLKTKTIEAIDERKARIIAEESGMTVTAIVALPEQEPTEKQLRFAKELGLTIPSSATRKETSDLISCHLYYDEPADAGLRALADRYDIVYTRYTGAGGIRGFIWRRLQQASFKDRVQWFTYCLYRDLLPRKASPVDNGPDHPAIKRIVEIILEDSSIVESIQRYGSSDLFFFGQKTSRTGEALEGASNRTKAYKQVAELLRADPSLQIPSQDTTGRTAGKVSPANNSGCLLIVATFVTSGVLAWM